MTMEESAPMTDKRELPELLAYTLRSKEELEVATKRLCIIGEEAGKEFFERHPHLGFKVALGLQCDVTERERQLSAALARAEKAEDERDEAYSRQKHTQTWYASHYGKLEDWARKILPEPWRNQFFSCVANGTYSHSDVGEAYICNAGFKVVPSGYIRMDDAKGQLIQDQTARAEAASSAGEH